MHIRRQHVISKVLLKRFADGSDDDPRLVGYNLHYGASKHYSITSVGYIEDFIPHDSEAAEAAWGSIETNVHPALEALEASTAELTGTHVETLKQLIALHYIRRNVIMDLAKGVYGNVREGRLRALTTEKWRLEPVGLEHLGRIPKTDNDIEEVTRWLGEKYDEFEAELLSGAIINAVRVAAPALENSHLQIWRAGEGEFLISDQGVLTLDRHAEPVRTGGLTRNFTHLLPIGRGTQIALAPRPLEVTLTGEQVNELNRLHLRIADRFVYYHPDSGLGAFCDLNRRKSSTSGAGEAISESDAGADATAD